MLQKFSNSFNANKNMVVSTFIKSLSEVQKNTHQVILNALDLASEQVLRELGQQNLDLQNRIYQVFEMLFRKLKERETTKVSSAASFLGISDCISLRETEDSMLKFVRTILENAEFFWKVSYVPDSKDLANCNVIETVIEAVDLSVRNYIAELNQIFDVIRKNWLRQFSSHTVSLLSTTMEAVEHKKEEQDLLYKAYRLNYQTLSDNSKDILSRCEQLWKEFERGEYS